MRVRSQALFGFFLLIFFALFVWLAKDWRLQARLYPWAVGIPMLALCLAYVVKELMGKDQAAAPHAVDNTPVDFQFTQGIDPAIARRRALNIFFWIFGFFFGIWLFGFGITIPAFVFLYLKLQSGEGWGLSLVLTGIAWLVFWGLFDRLLHLPFPEGVILSWIGQD